MAEPQKRRREDHFHIVKGITIGQLASVAAVFITGIGLYYGVIGRLQALEQDRGYNAQVLTDIRASLRRLEDKVDAATLREIDRERGR